MGLPKETCGHHAWGAPADELWNVEGRPRWPEAGNLPSTQDFLKLVQENAAPSGNIVAMLTGHVHRDFSTGLHKNFSAANRSALLCSERSPACVLGPRRVSLMEANALHQEMHLEARGSMQYT